MTIVCLGMILGLSQLTSSNCCTSIQYSLLASPTPTILFYFIPICLKVRKFMYWLPVHTLNNPLGRSHLRHTNLRPEKDLNSNNFPIAKENLTTWHEGHRQDFGSVTPNHPSLWLGNEAPDVVSFRLSASNSMLNDLDLKLWR